MDKGRTIVLGVSGRLKILNAAKYFSVVSMLSLAIYSSATASETFELEFVAVIDRIIVPGNLTLPKAVAEGVEIAGSLELVETERFKGTSVAENGGLQYWQNTVKSMELGEPLNTKFIGVYMGLNPSLAQLTIYYDVEKCATQPVLRCAVEGELVVQDGNQTEKKYTPIDYLLIHPGLKDSSIEYSEAVDLLVEGVRNEETKIILKMSDAEEDSSPLRVILKLTDMQLTKQ